MKSFCRTKLSSTSGPLVNIVKLLDLALALVLDLVNLVTNLAKPSLGQPSQKPDQT